MARALVHALLRASEDKEVRVVVITGAGRGFCAGGDLDYIRDCAKNATFMNCNPCWWPARKSFWRSPSMPKIVIAAVNGAAAGGGMSISLACDLRIASEEASLSRLSRS